MDRPKKNRRPAGNRDQRPSSKKPKDFISRGKRVSDEKEGEKKNRKPAGPGRKGPAGKSTGKPTCKSSFDARGKKPYAKKGAAPKPAGETSKRAGRRPPSAGRRASESKIGEMRLNKYLAHAGVASRREADTLIETGLVKVNGKVVTEMGYKVQDGDDVRYNDSRISPEKKVYVLLNKPKDFITTVDDPQNRKTVMGLVQNACPERIYPVGRLDRMTTGLLMFTNDGELAKRLTHPSYQVRKVYHVELDQSLKSNHFDDIKRGLTLDDGLINVDKVSYIEGATKKEIGIEIHSGRNRIVRRIFEHLGYKVIRLDRVVFAGLTKRNLKRGQWRYLSKEELQQMAMMGKAK